MSDSLHVFDAGGGRLSAVLGMHARRDPGRAALVFLEDGEAEAGRLTRAELHRRAMRTAAALRERDLVGERVLLAFHSSLDYVVAFFGCLYAGVIGVPVYPPRQNWHSRRLAAIAADAGAGIVLTSDALCEDVRKHLNAVDGVALATLGLDGLASTVDADHAGWINDAVRPGDLAYLQYTSGSTGDPKGVMVSHANLAANAAFIAQSGGLEGGGAFVSWLPIYHDMGLVAGIVLPLMLGATAVFMPPAAFVQQPLNWLRAIARYRGSFSAAPNFAYDLCVARIDAGQAATLDLSSWRVALNGAEPIWARTLDDFCERFAPSGVRSGLISGGYGMAEATLVVTIGALDETSPRLVVDKAALSRDRIVHAEHAAGDTASFVSSGHVRPGFDVRIVRAEDCRSCDADEIGEIWVAGPCVGGGYWQRTQETEDTFGAQIRGEPGRRWLRTGDLGFVHDGQLYVTGRLKDLLIVRGANHYPQDIERTAEASHPSLRVGGYGAAFTIDDAGASPRVVVVQEVERSARKQIDVPSAARALAEAVVREHGIDVDMVVLVPPATVPKTSSGKVQRRACRASLQAGELSEIGRWQRPAVATGTPSEASTDLSGWLRERIARLVGRPADEIATQRPFSELGLDSVRLVELVAELSRALDVKLPASLLFDHPSIDSLARHFAGGRLHPLRTGAEKAVPIAIVGMDCRVPGADGLPAFWDLLARGRVAIREVPPERARLTGWNAAPGAAHRFLGLVDDVDRFDAAMFGIAPREAQSIDPQQRMLLETSWHALERAHIAPDSLAGSATGVFVGICSNDYYRIQRAHGVGLDAHAGTGGASSIAANRISYCLGLQGPSMAIDTACSSSLVAIHQACLSLAAAETDLALAGGVNLVLSDDLGTVFGRAGMLAPDGRCKTFDASADGYVRGEGCGMLVLKRLDDALRDGNPVLAVIAGSAVNQDGFSNGLTAPNGRAQQQVVRAALQRAGIAGADVDYVEAHGTGTTLGDPIEVHALSAVLDTPAAGDTPSTCWLGAVKTQIGHLEAAAGVVGVIKAVLALRHGLVPGNCNYSELNPGIELGHSRLRPASIPVVWPARAGRIRHAGVSSFGFGGTNAHLILAEAPPAAAAAPGAVSPVLLHTLSAHTPQALRALAGLHAHAIEQCADPVERTQLSRVANTARSMRQERLAVCADDAGSIARALGAFAAGTMLPADVQHSTGCTSATPRVAFLFTGQGAHYAGMGQGLFGTEPVFRHALERCDTLLRPHLGLPLTEVMFGQHTDRLDDTRFAQPVLVSLQIALVALWAHYGVRPQWVCGHSVGEYAAAVACGLMDVETALRLVVVRARLMSGAPLHGCMLSVAGDEARVVAALGSLAEGLDVAARNSPRQTVLAGERGAVEQALVHLQGQGLLATQLSVSHAFHSSLMDPVMPAFAPTVQACSFGTPALPIVSTGGSANADMREPRYWVEQIRRPVCFADALLRLESEGARCFIEIGPSATLLSLVRDVLDGCTRIPSLVRGQDATLAARAALGAWWCAGGEPRFERLPGGTRSAAGDLPVYPFERRSHWFERAAFGPVPLDRAPAQGLLGQALNLASDEFAAFEATLPHASTEWLREHVVAGRPVMPAAGWIALALDAVRRTSDHASAGRAATLKGIRFEQPMGLAEPSRVQTMLTRHGNAWHVGISRRDAAQARWVECMSADALMVSEAAGPAAFGSADAEWAGIEADAFYAGMQQRGLAYGPAFRLLHDIRWRDGEASARLHAPPPGGVADGCLHPAWLDCVFQSVGVLLMDETQRRGRVPVPVALDRLQLLGLPPSLPADVRARVRTRDDDTAVVDLRVHGPDGSVLLHVDGLRLKWVDALRTPRADAPLSQRVAGDDGPGARSYASAWRAIELCTGVEPARWLVVAEQHAMARQLVDELHRGGAQALALPACLDDIDTLAASLRAALADAPVAGLLVALEGDDPAGAAAVTRGLALCRSLQRLLVACDRIAAHGQPFTLCLATRQALAGPWSAVESVAGAGAAAMWRSAARELQLLALRHVDLPAALSTEDAGGLVRALAGDETEWRVHAGQVYVRRLQPTRPSPAADGEGGELVLSGAVVVTGGTGALGMHVAQWLVDRGARHVYLVSRRLQVSAVDESRMNGWRAAGCTLELFAADVSRRDEVERLLGRIAEDGITLSGIVHAAGATDDVALHGLQDAQWSGVTAGKVLGAVWLDELTRELPLDFFIGFSSAAAPLGSPGQCNYAAANGMLEAVLRRRVVEAGLRFPTRVLALQWGPWAGAGMADSPAVRQALARRGIDALAPAEALDAIDQALRAAASPQLVGRFDWQRLAASAASGVVPSALRALIRHEPAAANAAAPADRPSADTLAGMDKPAGLAAIRRELASQLSQVLKLDPAQLPADAPPRFDRLRLSSLGLDSLMAMEIRNRMRGWVGVDLPAHLLIGATEIGAVIETIHEKLLLRCLSQPIADSGGAQAESAGMEVVLL